MKAQRISSVLVHLALVAAAGQVAFAGSHTWDVNELFSNTDGTIQFVELKEKGGGEFETGVGNQLLRSNAVTYDIQNNVVAPTSFKFLLFATQAFADLPGAPTPDEIIPDHFINTSGDTIIYGPPYDTLTFGAGALPTDGIHSLRPGGTNPVNTPTNYAGQVGSVDASPPPPPAVPDGSALTVPMTVVALDSTGSSLSIRWDTSTCTGATNHHIIYGEGSMLPGSPGGTFGVRGSKCSIGSSSPFIWNSVPDAADGTGLLWWVLVAVNASGIEGSWGLDGAGAERVGPGPGGSSGVCGVTVKNVTNSCGN